MKKIETPINFVAKYPTKHEIKSNIKKELQITKLEELGLIKSVKIDPNTASEINIAAKNTVTSIVDLPQNIKQNPNSTITMPKITK